MYGVLLPADMNAATPLGAWGRSAMSLDAHTPRTHTDTDADTPACTHLITQAVNKTYTDNG